MRIAAIDVGTNSIHMIVAEVSGDGSFQIVEREKEMVRLGTGGLDGRPLTRDACVLGIETLVRFTQLIQARGVDEILAVATSAVREAPNGGAFLAEVSRRTGLAIRVISGLEEARLTYAAAIYGVEAASGTSVVIDIGGGTTEVAVGDVAAVQTCRSLRLGAIRLTERFVRTDPLSAGDERRLVACIKAEAAEYLDSVRAAGFQRVIATSGTLLNLGEMALHGTAIDGVNHVRVPADTLHRLRKQIVAADMRHRLRLPALDSRRSDVIVAGAVLADTLVRLLGAPEFILCDFALREGLVLDFLARNRQQIAQVDRYPDIRRRSVIELGDRCCWAVEHARQVTRLALSLFDQTRSSHELDDRAREWLEYGAMLHDIGAHISYARHHKHSEYLIRNGGLRGFEPEEIQTIALLARYHRRTAPKKSHEAFAALPAPLRRFVRVASALLRLAECLDRSHAQLVQAIEWEDGAKGGRLRVFAKADIQLEVWAARRQTAPFAHELGRSIEIETAVRGARRAGTPLPAPRPSRRAVAEYVTSRAIGGAARVIRSVADRH